MQGGSTSQHMRPSVIRVACALAVVCGVSLRPMALLFSALFLIPITKASLKRWIADMGTHLPTPEEILQQLLALPPATECPLDGYYPLGPDHGVMVIKEEQDRLLLTQEAVSENGDEARQCLQQVTALSLNGTAAFADDSHSFPAAIKALWPRARLQADQFQTVKNLWRPLKKSL
jgi:hypothetical protein